MRIDRPFFEKLKNKSVYFNDDDEYYRSIIMEIGNIFSSRLKYKDSFLDEIMDKKSRDIPFLYGIRDFQSLNNFDTEKFKIQAREIIIRLEPRIIDFEIISLNFNYQLQRLEMNIRCTIKQNNKKINTKIFVK